MPVRALVCPRLVERHNRSPGQVCDNRYTRRSARSDKAILRRKGCQSYKRLTVVRYQTIPYTAGYTGWFNRYRMGSRQHTGRLRVKSGHLPAWSGRQWHAIPRRLSSPATVSWLLMISADSLHPSISRRHCLRWKRKDCKRW